MKWGMATGLAAWILLSIGGALIVLIPDEGNRLFSLSEGHGPSAQDAIGIVVLLIGWLAFLVPLYRSRMLVTGRRVHISASVVGAAILVWSLATDTGLWWMLGVAVLLTVQIVAGVSILRKG